MKKILVTGANGYIAKHVIADLYKRDRAEYNRRARIFTLENQK